MMNLSEVKMGNDKMKPEAGRKRFSLSLRQKRYWGALAAAFVLGLLMAVFLETTQPVGGAEAKFTDLFSSSAIGTKTALISVAIYGIFAPLILYFQHIGMDEQEERAYLLANTASWYFIIVVTPIWWILSRADILPPIQVDIMVISSLAINFIVWGWKKFF
jgi:hypothetical protein